MSKTPEEMAAETAAAAAAQAAAGKDGKVPASALSQGEEKPETWIPEKFHVRKDGKKDGPLDVEASMRAVAKSHVELTKRMVDVGLPPESADAYELEVPKGFDVAAFRKDAKTADFLKGAHSLGMTNKQINYVVNKYLEAAPGLVEGAQELSNEECIAQLALVWKSDAELAGNLRLCNLAATRLAEAVGMKYDDVDAAFGNNPVFIRLMAGLAKQMGEDVPPLPSDGGADNTATDFDSQASALRKELDGIPERDSKARAAVHAKLNALYEKRYGQGKRAPVFTQDRSKVA